MSETIKNDYILWIKNHLPENYNIITVNDNEYNFYTEFGLAVIKFTDVETNTIVEFTITSKKDDTVKFYLHFELNDVEHAKQLYNEMIDTLIGLKDEKTIRVLLSCSAGLTTSMFAENLNSTAQMLTLDYHFDAVSYLSIYEQVEKYDVVLLAPQIGYMLKRLSASLPEKLVLQIPTASFAAYDSLNTIKFIQDELANFNATKDDSIKTVCSCKSVKYRKRILSLVMVTNRAQVQIYYRLYDKGDIIDSNRIIKPNININDLYDVIDTILLKHGSIDAVGIATPGIVAEEHLLTYKSYDENIKDLEIDLKKDFKVKYPDVDVFLFNNANAAAVGFSLEHPKYKNIIFHSQPFGYGIGGQGIINNGKIVTGINGIAGEVKFFLPRMQLSDETGKFAWSEQGALELVTKSLLPSICILGSEAVVIRSPMTPDMNEIKKKLNSFIPDEFLPKFYSINTTVAYGSYMLDGITKLCIDYLEEIS